MSTVTDVEELAAVLARGGFVAAQEEAGALVARAGGDVDLLDSLVRRRLTGEPLGWIIGRVPFCGVQTRVAPGVYVPREHSQALAWRAVERLPAHGVAVDLCTGSGAIAQMLMAHRPTARVVACEVDERAASCAEANGVEVYRGDLFTALPRWLQGCVDVVVGVLPYVPTSELSLLQRDTFTFESSLAYDGGHDGTDLLRRAIADSATFLRGGGALLLELGGEQQVALAEQLSDLGYCHVTELTDSDGDLRGIEAIRSTHAA